MYCGVFSLVDVRRLVRCELKMRKQAEYGTSLSLAANAAASPAIIFTHQWELGVKRVVNYWLSVMTLSLVTDETSKCCRLAGGNIMCPHDLLNPTLYSFHNVSHT